MRLRAWLLLFGLSCCDDASTPGPVRAPDTESLQPGVAARVGDESIASARVAAVAAARGVAPPAARELLITDALFAAHAKSGGIEPSQLAQVERAALARALLERFDQQARMAGPPTDAEVAEITERRWVELDRPPAARTIHAVVLVKEGTDRARARALAERISEAVRGISEAAEFKRRAEAVPKGSLEARVEALPAVTPDGRTFQLEPPARRGPLGNFDPTFAQAANAIAEVGEHSPIVETRFGHHVILLLEKLPEVRHSLEQRRELVRDEVFGTRAQRLRAETLAKLQAASPIAIDRAAETLTAELGVTP